MTFQQIELTCPCWYVCYFIFTCRLQFSSTANSTEG